jgi:hypothetical protein
MPTRNDGEGPGSPGGGVQSGQLRVPLSLQELLELLVGSELLLPEQGREIAARATTLHSRVLKDRVGSIRSQAAARYDVTPAEVVAAAGLAHATRPHRKLDEDAIAEALGRAAGVRYLKIDPLRIDNDLVSKTLSRCASTTTWSPRRSPVPSHAATPWFPSRGTATACVWPSRTPSTRRCASRSRT